MGTQAAANLQSVDAGQHDIQDDGIEVGTRLRGQARLAVAADLDLVAARAQILAQHFHKAGIVVDEKDTRWHDQETSRTGKRGE
jgi:hypothetical protein